MCVLGSAVPEGQREKVGAGESETLPIRLTLRL